MPNNEKVSYKMHNRQLPTTTLLRALDLKKAQTERVGINLF